MTKQRIKSSGNVYADMGFSHAEAEHLKIRSELVIAIEKYIAHHHLTQTEAAKRFGINQPRLSKLLSGHIELFTIDKLVDMLANVDVKVKLKVAA
ncbi:MAG: helix-turn-helix transcriptional regulator [Pseudomonadota bacterium]